MSALTNAELAQLRMRLEALDDRLAAVQALLNEAMSTIANHCDTLATIAGQPTDPYDKYFDDEYLKYGGY